MLGEIWTYRRADPRRRSTPPRPTRASTATASGSCDVRPLIALRASLPYWFPRVNEIIRRSGSHNLLATPTAAQFADPELRPLIDRYLRGARRSSPRSSAPACSAWPGISSAARWPAATSSTSGSIWDPAPATARARNNAPIGPRRIGWWTGS